MMNLISIISLFVLLFSGCSQNQAQKTKSNNKQITETHNQIPSLNSDTTFTFNNCEINNLPVEWSQYTTGNTGEKPNWKVVSDNGRKVMAQLSKNNPNNHFNVVVFDGFNVKNSELKVKMKGVTGKMDQGGGFIWRYLDANNYYVVRANPLEDNVVLYKVENGKRTDLPVLGEGRTYGVDVNPLGSGWNTLGLKVMDNLFTVFLNNKQIFQVKDETFQNAGKIGLWTKADAVSYFMDYQVIPTSK